MLYSVLKCPLLAAGKLMTTLLQVAGGLIVIGATIGIPLILFNQDRVVAGLANGAIADGPAIIGAIVGLMAMALIGGVLVFFFFRMLGRIINTVGDGDPFVPHNADRLRLMGWVALAFQLIAIPVAAMSTFVGTQLPAAALHVDTEISFNGIMMAIVLFILARVFRRGTAMREELEGTI
ncbi:MAG: DUF2975 domain-containing protein [Novosphingobium sp.]|nr:DUF2975 domain-containing protein [Novosphingobium sp.]